MSDNLEAHGHHAITHNGETYIKLADTSVTFSLYRKDIATQAARIAALEAAVTQCRTLSAMLKPQAARIAELEAALKKIVEKTRHAHPLSYVSDYYRIASAALEGGKKDG